MSTISFYRQQAARQQAEVDGAVLDNVRVRSQQAADAWTKLADRLERAEEGRATRDAEVAATRAATASAEAADQGFAAA